MTTMSILDFKEFAATLGSQVPTNPMSTSSPPVLRTPRLQGEGGFSISFEALQNKSLKAA